MKIFTVTSQKDKKSTIEGLYLIEPKIFSDNRGFFYESFNHQKFEEVIGQKINFVQDNHSRSKRTVLRGLHYQLKNTQGKLVRVSTGAVWDVAVDLRKNSPTFGHWAGFDLTDLNHIQYWIPKGFAHGFVVKSDFADFLYKTTDYWSPEDERILLWNDLPIVWPVHNILISEKDQQGKKFVDCEYFDY